jgi:hypothetical protein
MEAVVHPIFMATALGLGLSGTWATAAAGGALASAAASGKAETDLEAWLAAPRAERSALSNAAFAVVPLTRGDAARAVSALRRDHAAFLQDTRAAEMKAKVIELGGLKMKFEMLTFTNGSATNGRSLFLSLHGGGGAPPAVNESQWRNQVRLGQGYHPSEGIYLAPRAPTDAWNLCHQGHIDTLFSGLVPRTVTTLARTLEERGDTNLTFSAAVNVTLP